MLLSSAAAFGSPPGGGEGPRSSALPAISEIVPRSPSTPPIVTAAVMSFSTVQRADVLLLVGLTGVEVRLVGDVVGDELIGVDAGGGGRLVGRVHIQLVAHLVTGVAAVLSPVGRIHRAVGLDQRAERGDELGRRLARVDRIAQLAAAVMTAFRAVRAAVIAFRAAVTAMRAVRVARDRHPCRARRLRSARPCLSPARSGSARRG